MRFPFRLHSLLEPYAYRTPIGPLLFLLSGALSLLIALLTVGFQSWNTASTQPADSLRWE